MSGGWTSGLTFLTRLIIFIAIVIALVSGGVVLAMYATASAAAPQSSSLTSSSDSTTTSPHDSLVGYQTGYVPQGTWSNYLGYIPSGYKIAPRLPDAPIFPCPPGMSTSQCQLFQQTCGNGVCDPNETCQSCPIDCLVTGALTCDPYTGRPGSPASVCQITQLQEQAQLPGG
jgi:hypothetical protein